jgi:hypothetical protein
MPTAAEVRDLLTPEQLALLDRVSAPLKDNPHLLDRRKPSEETKREEK